MRKYLPVIAIVATILLLANSSQHPTNPNGGYTRAPLDGACTECHRNGNNNLSGSFDLLGLPEISIAGEIYELKVRVTNPSADAMRAGFQLVGIESDLSNAGEWMSDETDVLIKKARQRNYIGHAPARPFNDDNISEWILKWAPQEGDAGNNTIYGAGMIGNGADGNQGDRAIFRQWSTTTYLPEDTLIADIVPLRHISGCRDTMDGRLSIDLIGGIPPYHYVWSTADTTMIIDSLGEGTYTVTITDSIGQVAIPQYIMGIPEDLTIENITVSDVTDEQDPDGMIRLSINGGNAPYDILWFNVDSTQSIGSGDTLNNLAQGQYYSEIIDQTGCVILSDTIFVQLNTSIQEVSFIETSLYPNPSTIFFTLRSEEVIRDLSIYDLSGNIRMIKTINDTEAGVDIQGLIPGIYIVRYNFVKFNSGFQSFKLVVAY